jgi:hypothetical protein
MSLRTKFVPQLLPAPIRKQILAELFEAAAQAFDCPAPAYARLSYAEVLRTYALFTSERAEQALRSERDVAALKTRLYQNAYPLGGKIRHWFGLASIQDVMTLGAILYGAIGVDMHGGALGEITVKRCYFSRFYSGPVCNLISALDDGVFSGLSGGGRLVFSERLTEGGEGCQARLLPREAEHK